MHVHSERGRTCLYHVLFALAGIGLAALSGLAFAPTRLILPTWNATITLDNYPSVQVRTAKLRDNDTSSSPQNITLSGENNLENLVTAIFRFSQSIVLNIFAETVYLMTPIKVVAGAYETPRLRFAPVHHNVTTQRILLFLTATLVLSFRRLP